MNIQIVKFEKTSFTISNNPQALELKFLKKEFGFSPLHLDDFVNKTQVPKIEVEKNYTLIVLDFPYFYQNGQSGKTNPLLGLLNIPQPSLPHVTLPKFYQERKNKSNRMISSQIDFFIGADFLVVLHDDMLSPISDVFALCQKTLRKRKELMEKGPGHLFYYLIDRLVDNLFSTVNEISLSIDRIDRRLETGQSEEILDEISTVRRNIVVSHTMVKPMLPIFRQLEEGKYQYFNGELISLWSNILDHLQKNWDRMEDNRELLEGIAVSNESLLASRTNNIVRFLTIITSLSFPFIIVNNLYSMNIVGLPFAQQAWIVWALFAMIFISAGLIMLYFRYHRWL